MPKKTTQAVLMVRVIRDSRDAGQDFFIPRDTAKKLFDAGKLSQSSAGSGWDYDSEGRTKGDLEKEAEKL